MHESSKKSPTWLVAVAWLFVSLPLAWGLYQSIVKSKPLFAHPEAKQAPSSPQTK